MYISCRLHIHPKCLRHSRADLLIYNPTNRQNMQRVYSENPIESTPRNSVSISTRLPGKRKTTDCTKPMTQLQNRPYDHLICTDLKQDPPETSSQEQIDNNMRLQMHTVYLHNAKVAMETPNSLSGHSQWIFSCATIG